MTTGDHTEQASMTTPDPMVLPWWYWGDVVDTDVRVCSYPYGGGVARSGVQITLGQRGDGQVMAVRLPAEEARNMALAILGETTPIPPLHEDPVAIRLGLVPCCDSHNEHCEPPSELCCGHCVEAAHDTFPIRHADGSRCVLAEQGSKASVPKPYGPGNPQCSAVDAAGLDCAGPAGHPDGSDHGNINGTWPHA